MITLIVIGIAFAAILVQLCRVIASDGYGVRPPPRSHRDLGDLDNRGMPTKHTAFWTEGRGSVTVNQ